MWLQNMPRLPGISFSERNYHAGMSGRLYVFERIVADLELIVFYKPVLKSTAKNYLGLRGTGFTTGLGYAHPFFKKSELLFSAGFGKNYANINYVQKKEYQSLHYKIEYPDFKNYKTTNDFVYLSFAYYYNFNSFRTGPRNQSLKAGIKISHQIDRGDSYSSHSYKESYPRISTDGFLLSLIFGLSQQ